MDRIILREAYHPLLHEITMQVAWLFYFGIENKEILVSTKHGIVF